MSPAPATATARSAAAASAAARRAGTARRPAAAQRTVTRSPAPRAPRRVSGPTRPISVPRPAVGAGLGAWVRTLPDHHLLDRLIRGRAWIVLIGALLAGIVFLQVSMLRMNAGISRAVEQSQTLQRQNQQLQASVAALGSDSRLRALAERQGYYTPQAGSEHYLTAAKGNAARAVGTMRTPKPLMAAATGTAASSTATSTTASTTATPSSTATASGAAPSSTTTSGTATTTSGTTTSGTATSGTATSGTATSGTTTTASSGATSGTTIAPPTTQTQTQTGATGGAGTGG